MKSDKRNLLIKRTTKYSLLLLLIMAQFCISGCWNYLEVNNTAIPLGIGFDYQNNQAQFSVQYATPSSTSQEAGGTSAPQALVITETAETAIEAARRTALDIPRLGLWSHAHTLLIGENLARRDLALCIDSIARNRNIRKTANLYICAGVSVRECLQAEMPLEPFSANGLNKMISNQENQLGIYMPIHVATFEQHLATPGIDAAAPVITVKENSGKKMLTLAGTAVFKNRQMVGILNEEESRGYRYLSTKQINGGMITINPTGQGPVLIELTRSQASIKPKVGPNGITMQIRLEAEGNFYGQDTAKEILTRENIKNLEKYTNQKMSADIKSAVSKCQMLQSDIFGWGREIHRTHPAYWREIQGDWPSIFAGVKTEINVNFKLRRTYLAIKSFKFRH
ncbi:MAG: Ger(x)C family spore germination protein [Syntrophomonadaceae bacterium]|jgi:spore germination protein KC